MAPRTGPARADAFRSDLFRPILDRDVRGSREAGEGLDGAVRVRARSNIFRGHRPHASSVLASCHGEHYVTICTVVMTARMYVVV